MVRVLHRDAVPRWIRPAAGVIEGTKGGVDQFCLSQTALEEVWRSDIIGLGLTPPTSVVAAYHKRADCTDDTTYNLNMAMRLLPRDNSPEQWE